MLTIWISYIIFSISTFSIYLESQYTVNSDISIIYEYKYKVIPQPMWEIGRMITVCVGQHYIVQTTYVKNNVTWMWPVRDPSPSSQLNIHTLLDIKQVYTLLGCLTLQASIAIELSNHLCLSVCIFNFQHSTSFFPNIFNYFQYHIIKTVLGKGLLYNINLWNYLSLSISSYTK